MKFNKMVGHVQGISTHLMAGLSKKVVKGHPLAECVQYGSTQWGHFYTADVKLANRTAAGIAVHLIDASDTPIPLTCNAATMDTCPESAHINGVLGVAPWPEDCGAGCAASASLFSMAGILFLELKEKILPRTMLQGLLWLFKR